MTRYDPPAPGYSGAFYSTSPPAPPAPPTEKRRSGLGAAALVLGLLALLFGWVPILGLAMIPPALLAVLLGVVGFVAAVVTGRTGKALPFIASVIGVFALLLPAASTVVFALSVAPWAYTVGMDQVQIELEHDLKGQGVATDQAERVSREVGEALRSFARPSEWRDGIAAAHRFGLICEDYERALVNLDENDVEARKLAGDDFRSELQRLAERHGANLSMEDLNLLSDFIGREQIRRADNHRQWNRRYEQSYEIEEGFCPFSSCDESDD